MGGCCCHSSDTKDDDQEKCVIVKNEEPQSPRKEYGSLSTMEDKNELYYAEPQEPTQLLGQRSNGYSNMSQSEEENGVSEANSSTNDASQIDMSLQEGPGSGSSSPVSCQDDDASVPETKDIAQAGVDREIDQLVAAAMATKVIYPPDIPQQETSLSQSSAEPTSPRASSTSPQTTQQEPTEDADNDRETGRTKRISLIQKTQRSFKRAKARATSMVSIPSKQSSAEQDGGKKPSLQEKKTKHPSVSDNAPEKDTKKTHYAKKGAREGMHAVPANTERTRKKAVAPVGGMKSHYAKDRVARMEVERDVRERMASQRSANDPRKAALERGERLGQLDDTIDEMRDHSSSFARVARQLKDEQRGRTSTFPW